VHHLYRYASLEERAQTRAALDTRADWQAYLQKVRPHVASQESTIYVEAEDVHAAAGVTAATLASGLPTGGVYELRHYQLVLGYSPVKDLRAAFCSGIPAKLRASSEGEFLLLASSEIGRLNSVIELWRFDDAAACLRHREASRKSEEWKKAIAAVAGLTQSFTTTLLKPSPCSPLQ
jgi:hypothetical protein